MSISFFSIHYISFSFRISQTNWTFYNIATPSEKAWSR
jgi:hypothetical protein